MESLLYDLIGGAVLLGLFLFAASIILVSIAHIVLAFVQGIFRGFWR